MKRRRSPASDLTGGAEITVWFPASSPALAAFRRSGRIRLQVGAEAVTSGVAPTPMVMQLLHDCTH